MSASRLRRRPQRGFTLIELMVSAAITLTILAAVATTFIGVQGAYQSEAQVKGAVENGRTALSYLERTIGLAGYGLPPAQAFDFDVVGGFAKDNTTDATVGFLTDDLAVRFRDPQYLRRGTLDGTTIQLETGSTFGVAFKSGQGLVVACTGGRSYALVRTAASALATASTVQTTTTPVFVPPNVSTADRCFKETGDRMPFVMVMHERRFRIVSLGGRPFLVVFHNLNAPDPASNTDFEPLASDVEQFQVAYGMNRPTSVTSCCTTNTAIDSAGNSNWMLLDASGDPAPVEATLPDYSTPYNDALRFNTNGANIRSVRVSLVMRSTAAKAERRKIDRERLENAPSTWTATAVPDGFYRYTLRSTVRTPNMTSRSFFTPPIRLAGNDDDELNYTGG